MRSVRRFNNGRWALKTGKLDTLSPQQFLDCTPNPHHCGQGDGPGGDWGSGGCDGGTPELAYAAAAKAGGLQTGWDYPYESYMGKDFDCRLGAVKLHRGKQANVTGVFKTIANNYTSVYDALANRGPLAISVDTTGWDSYESGVFDGCNQTHPDLDHVVLLAGAGTDPDTGLAYWQVRNSWSPWWGDSGWIKIRRAVTDAEFDARCGVDLAPGDGSGCDNGPSTVTVCGTCGILFDTTLPLVE